MRFKFTSLGICSAVVLVALAGSPKSLWKKPSALAQAQSQDPPTLKDFGSSLKRLKWDDVKKKAVEVKTETARRDGEDEDVVRIETQLVVCDVLVLDKRGRPVEGLTQADFTISDDGQRQHISHFSLGDNVDVGRSIVLIVDYSKSQVPYLDTSIEAAKMLVNKLGPKDRMAIVTDDIQLLVDFSRNKTELKEALESLRDKVRSGVTGKSSQFSALMATVREMFGPEDIRPIIIFPTDGDELQFLQPPSEAISRIPEERHKIKEYSVNDISVAAEKSRATIYSVVSGVRILGLPRDEKIRRVRIYMDKAVDAGYQLQGKIPQRRPPFSDQLLAHNAERQTLMQAAIAKMSESTGGWIAYLEEPEQAKEIFSGIFSDVNRRYVIGYYPNPKPRDGKRHKVLIEVRNHPEYVVEGRRSYVAPEPNN